ncbi:MAG TPA: shikimate dehydrogenase [Coxiellaceae bacterium]|nr:MAG: shikimate dehydrogenase [Gammaproteobacteria bacterium RIFCSPHIGHO2_12_FULL_36_30]HLB56097.1 shikimate dehydrogenase [Coxiellaceae bacterium]
MSKYAVFGNPISHSLSPQIHTAFAKQFDMTIDYQKILAPLDQFKNTVDAFRAQGGLGANITIPFKIQAFEYADQLTDRAKLAGAVNTFIFKNNICIGDNTDGVGFIRDLKNNYFNVSGKNILILGAGGAARGILGEIIREKPNKIFIYNRTIENTEKLIMFFASRFPIKILAHEKQFDLIINTANTDSRINFNTDLQLDLSNTFLYDLNYGERRNIFFKNDGLGMLIEQAAESFYLWFDKKPEIKHVLRAIQKQCGQ